MPPLNLADIYNNHGKDFARCGEYALAVQNYDEAIKFNPNLAEAYNNRGTAYFYLKPTLHAPNNSATTAKNFLRADFSPRRHEKIFVTAKKISPSDFGGAFKFVKRSFV